MDIKRNSVNNIKVISFDLDNTLYYNQPVIRLAEKKSQEYLASEFKKQNQEFDIALFITIRKKLLKRKNTAFDNLTLLRKECLRIFCMDLQDSSSIIKKAIEIFIEERQQVEIPKEIVDMIEILSKKYILVSITNGNCDARNLVCGKYFANNYSPQQGLRSKPHPEMYQKVIVDYQLESDELLHVGDEVKIDGLGAYNAGCQFSLLKPFNSSENINTVINNFLSSLITKTNNS